MVCALAMSSRHALKLCPDLVIVSGRMDAYKEASREIHGILRDYTELIEGGNQPAKAEYGENQQQRERRGAIRLRP